jgi:hypothetical protein
MSDDESLKKLGLRHFNEVIAEKEEQEKEEETSEMVVYEGSENLPAVPEPDIELLTDIDTAKQNIQHIIDVGTSSLKEIADVAKATESPTAFMAQVQMMKALLEANREKVAMSEKKKFEKTEQPVNHSTTNVTNNNLVLSTADLLEMLKGGSKS